MSRRKNPRRAEGGNHATPDGRMNGPYRRGQLWRVHITTGRGRDRTTSYLVFKSYSEAADAMQVSSEWMTAESEGLLRRAALVESSRGGWVYAIAVAPEVSRCRLKIGFTADVVRRFAQHRTTNPTALLVAAWEASAADEAAAHQALSGRIGMSEVFLVRSIVRALESLDGVLGPRMKPLRGKTARNPRGAKPALVQRDFATARQKPPRPNHRPAIADLVIRDMRARQELGERRYGVALQAGNGRDALVDAYQEALDLAIYLRQLLEERGAVVAEPTAPTP